MSSRARPDDRREARAQRRDHLGGVVDRQRRLGDVGEPGGVARGDRRHVGRRLDQDHGARRQLAHGADHLRVAGMADHHHLQAGLVMALGLAMNLGDQRAGGVDVEHPPRLGLGGHRLRHAVRREHHRPVGRALVELLDEDRALGAQPVDDEAVVHDLVADIDRRAPLLERHLDDLDRPVDAGAEAARRGEVEGQGLGHRSYPVGRKLFRRGAGNTAAIGAEVNPRGRISDAQATIQALIECGVGDGRPGPHSKMATRRYARSGPQARCGRRRRRSPAASRHFPAPTRR